MQAPCHTAAHEHRPWSAAAFAGLLLALATVGTLLLLGVGCTGGEETTTTSATTGATTATAPAPDSSDTSGSTSTTGVPIVSAEGEVVFGAPYGDGPGEFGFIPANESIADGPRAFWPLAGGDLYILDPVNRQVRLVPSPGSGSAGGGVQAIPIAEALAPRDLAIAADGALVIDDSDGSATYQVYSSAGELRDRVESAFGEVISAALASDGTMVYALMATGESGKDLAYVPLYQDGGLLDPKDHLGSAGTRVPLGSGWTAEAGTRATEDSGGVPEGTLRVYQNDQLWLDTKLEPRPLGGFVLQRTTAGEVIVSALAELDPGAAGGPAGGSSAPAPARMVWLFDDGGELVARTQLPLEQNLVDTFVTPARSTPDGALYTLNSDDRGLTIRRFQVE